jgi:hypothetical protein
MKRAASLCLAPRVSGIPPRPYANRGSLPESVCARPSRLHQPDSIVQSACTALCRRFAPRCARCLHRIVQSACTVLCRRFAPRCARCLHRIVQDVCTALCKALAPHCAKRWRCIAQSAGDVLLKSLEMYCAGGLHHTVQSAGDVLCKLLETHCSNRWRCIVQEVCTESVWRHKWTTTCVKLFNRRSLCLAPDGDSDAPIGQHPV